MLGIDVSTYQKANYKKYIDDPKCEFVIARAAWRFSVDPMCDVMIQYARSKGKKIGVYFFPLTSDGDPNTHAEWSYKQILGYINEAIICLDWESYSGAEGKLDYRNTDWARQWLNKMYELSGVKPLIYMNSYTESAVGWQPVVNGDYGLWIANYGNNNGQNHGRPKTKYWKVAAIHQYTSRLNGQSLDGDEFFGDRNTWDLYAKSTKVQTPDKPAPELPVKTYTEEEVKAILLQSENKYQKQIDEQLNKLREISHHIDDVQEVLKS